MLTSGQLERSIIEYVTKLKQLGHNDAEIEAAVFSKYYYYAVTGTQEIFEAIEKAQFSRLITVQA